MRLNQVTVGVTDLARAVAFYERLGLEQIVASPPDYARFLCPDGNSTFSLERIDWPTSTTVVYFECDDLDSVVARLAATGIELEQEPTDQPWLWREARLRDPDGNPICLFTAGTNRVDPPWRITPRPDAE
ncbi:MAG: VOC family protein [Myxococcales bacterium]|nr:MAG: VOC family protein [Myxococcales bacterium]